MNRPVSKLLSGKTFRGYHLFPAVNLTREAAGVRGPERTGKSASATVGHRKAVTKDSPLEHLGRLEDQVRSEFVK